MAHRKELFEFYCRVRCKAFCTIIKPRWRKVISFGDPLNCSSDARWGYQQSINVPSAFATAKPQDHGSPLNDAELACYSHCLEFFVQVKQITLKFLLRELRDG